MIGCLIFLLGLIFIGSAVLCIFIVVHRVGAGSVRVGWNLKKIWRFVLYGAGE